MNRTVEKTIEIMESLKDYSVKETEDILYYMRLAINSKKEYLQAELKKSRIGDINWDEAINDRAAL